MHTLREQRPARACPSAGEWLPGQVAKKQPSRHTLPGPALGYLSGAKENTRRSAGMRRAFIRPAGQPGQVQACHIADRHAERDAAFARTGERLVADGLHDGRFWAAAVRISTTSFSGWMVMCRNFSASSLLRPRARATVPPRGARRLGRGHHVVRHAVLHHGDDKLELVVFRHRGNLPFHVDLGAHPAAVCLAVCRRADAGKRYGECNPLTRPGKAQAPASGPPAAAPPEHPAQG